MAYYDARTGKRVTSPVKFWLYVTLLGIGFINFDTGRVYGIIMLIASFFAWCNIIREAIENNKSNENKTYGTAQSNDSNKSSFYNPPAEAQNNPRSVFYNPPPKSTNPEKSSSADSIKDQELDRIYKSIYNATPNNGSLDQLMKLFGNEEFRQKVCTSNDFCRMIFHEHISRDLLGYIYEHNKPAAYLICYDIVKAVTQKRN